MKDYPAGHSVDTRWYAIDECGHVASFYTSESGAIPCKGTAEIGEFFRENEVALSVEERFSIETISVDHVALLAKTFRGIHRDLKMSFGGVRWGSMIM